MLALLLCGHALGDFVFQTEQMVRRKHEVRWLLYHSLAVTLIQGVFLLPFFSLATLFVLPGIGISHALIDRLKVISGKKNSQPLRHFLIDQTLHLLVLAGAWLILRQQGNHDPLLPFFETQRPAITAFAVGLAAYAFNWNGGAAVVGALLHNYALPGGNQDSDDTHHTLRMGRMIGILERMLLLTLVLVNQWGALGLILAAKSLARFKDLDQRPFSEYYLIGTLTSVLIAIASGLTVRVLV